MGKKMGINTKAVEARGRKDAQKKAAVEAIEKKKEDEFWRDDDKYVNRKMNRQREREQKAQQERERKLGNKAAYELDMELAQQHAKAKSIKHHVPELPIRPTQYEIQKSLSEEEQKQQAKQKLENNKINTAPLPLEPNVNRMEDVESATGIDQALELLKATSGVKPIPQPATSSKRK